MYDALVVRIRQRRADVSRNIDHLLNGKRRLIVVKPVLERMAIDKGHGESHHLPGLAGVVDRHDVGVLEPGYDLDLALEPLDPDLRGDLRPENLERDLPAMLAIFGQKHNGRDAGTEFPLDDVAVRNGLSQPVDEGRRVNG